MCVLNGSIALLSIHMSSPSESDVIQLATALWVPFRPQIESGLPTFFCFSGEWLAQSMSAAGIPFDDPVDYLNGCASSLLQIQRRGVRLRSRILQTAAGSSSLVIVLVCQQVLAVERMSRDVEGFSEHAYFPRLRAMISPILVNMPSNPFESEEFEFIWRTLANDVRLIPGSCEDSVTFRFGIEQGVNKARSFPFSQALLSQHDLISIVTKMGAQRIVECTSESLWPEVTRFRDELGRRTQKLLFVGPLRDRLLAQIRHFASLNKPALLSKTIRDAERNSKWRLRAFKESIDWMTEEIRLILYDPETGARNYDRFEVEEEVDRRLRLREIVVLSEGELRDCWELNVGQSHIYPGESIILVGSKSDVEQILECGPTGGRNTDWEVDCKTSDVASNGTLAAEVTWPMRNAATLVWRNGAFSVESAIGRRAGHTWLGGIRVSARGDKYLWSALPFGILFADEELPITAFQQIDDHYLTFDDFYGGLENLTEDAEFQFKFSGGRKARLSVAIRRRIGSMIVGYPLGTSGRLSATARRISLGDSALIGLKEVGLVHARTISVSLWARVFADLQHGIGDKLDPEIASLICSSLQFANLPNEVGRAIAWLVQQENSRLSSAIVQELQNVVGTTSIATAGAPA
jgi:hypothetical protein